MLIRGEASDEINERGRRLAGDAVLLLVNGGNRSRPLYLAQARAAGHVVRSGQYGARGASGRREKGESI